MKLKYIIIRFWDYAKIFEEMESFIKNSQILHFNYIFQDNYRCISSYKYNIERSGVLFTQLLSMVTSFKLQ